MNNSELSNAKWSGDFIPEVGQIVKATLNNIGHVEVIGFKIFDGWLAVIVNPLENETAPRESELFGTEITEADADFLALFNAVEFLGSNGAHRVNDLLIRRHGKMIESWCVEDVLESTGIQNPEDAKKVLYRLANESDASVGICWDSIDTVADLVLNEK